MNNLIVSQLLSAAVLVGIGDAIPSGLRIMYGDIAEEGEFPFLVHLEISNVLIGGVVGCGGSIITPSHILTAAHCVTDCELDNGCSIRVTMGVNDLQSPHRQVKNVSEVHLHEKYRALLPISVENDIAILTLEEPIELGEAVSPICLPANNPADYGTVTFMGWGLTETNQVSNILKKGSGESRKECGEKHFFCVPADPRTTTTNQGDSGGPVIVAQQKPVQVGIVSHSSGPVIVNHTRVSDYLKWIEHVVKASSQPQKICKAYIEDVQ